MNLLFERKYINKVYKNYKDYIQVYYTILVVILEHPKNLAVTRECRYKIAFLKKSEEHLYDTAERLVDEEIKRLSLTVPPMPKDYK